MSDPIKHECGIALIRLRKPLAYYNEKYGFEGYLFQGRPKSIVVEDGLCAQKLIAYLHTGPTRAGLCKTIEELDQFKDCTHSTVMGNSYFPNLNIDQILKLYSSD